MQKSAIIVLITHLQNKDRLEDLKTSSKKQTNGKLSFSHFVKLCTSNKKRDNINRLRRKAPHIVLLDEKLLKKEMRNAYEEEIKKAVPQAKIIYISAEVDWQIVKNAMVA